MKYSAIALLILATTCTTSGQHTPPPLYLTQQPFPDSVKALVLQTPEGDRLSFGELLDEYKGRKVLVDIWASWCRDCIIGYPKLEALRKSAGEDIAYIFLSADKDKQKWKSAIKKFDMRGNHYLMHGAWKNVLSNYVVLDWVPRYLVLDENGNIIVPKAIEADDIALKNALIKTQLE